MYGFRGMGVLDYNDLMAQAGLRDCDPMDSACVSNNVARQAAVEDFWVAHQGGVPDDTRLTFTPQTSQQVQEFYNPLNIANGGNVVDTRGILQVSWPHTSPAPAVPVVPSPSSSYGTCGNPPQIRVSYVAGAPVMNSEDITALANWSKCTGIKSSLPAPPPSSPAPKSTGSAPVANVPSDYSATFTLPTVGGFDLSSIPWWGWAGAAAVGLFALKGGR